MPLLLRLAVAASVIAALGWASVAALGNGRVDAILASSGREMLTWTAASPSPGAPSWDWIRTDLDRAASLDPGNPAVQELLGLLKARRLESFELMDQSVGHYSRSLALRPVSPYGWANLVEAKYRLGRPAGEIEAALARAADLGPAEPAVQRVVVDHGLAVWREVSESTRGSIERMLAAGLRRNPLEMLRISERRGRLDVACRLISEVQPASGGYRASYCQGAGPKS